jgi:predicted GNAT family acetyltransferase
MVIPSVVVDRAIEGRGVAGALTRAALGWAEAEGLCVDPVCPYVDAWMRRHPQFGGLRA